MLTAKGGDLRVEDQVSAGIGFPDRAWPRYSPRTAGGPSFNVAS